MAATAPWRLLSPLPSNPAGKGRRTTTHTSARRRRNRKGNEKKQGKKAMRGEVRGEGEDRAATKGNMTGNAARRSPDGRNGLFTHGEWD